MSPRLRTPPAAASRHPRLRAGAAIAATLALTLGSQRALAHGSGLPAAKGLRFDRGGDAPPLVWSTYGVMIPEGPLDYAWVCEEVAGGDARSTAFETLPGGRWLMATGIGLFSSDDHCEWAAAPSLPEGLDVSAVKVGAAGVFVAAAETAPGAAGPLYLSTDGAETFAPALTEVFGPDVGILSLLLGADGQPQWVTGVQTDPEGESAPVYFWRGGEGGEAVGGAGSGWRRYAFDVSAGDQILALFVEGEGAAARGFGAARSGEGDVLVEVSAQGDVEARRSFRGEEDYVTAVARGVPPGRYWAGGRRVGLLLSEDFGETWAVADGERQAGCLSQVGRRLYQCADPYFDGGAVLSRLGEEAPEVEFTFGWVRGPLACPEGSDVARICAPLWDTVRVYGMDAPTPTPAPTLPPTPGEGCRGGGEGDPSGAGIGFLVGGALALAQRRRRRR